MDRADIPRVAVDNPIPSSWEAQTAAQERRAAAAAEEAETPPHPSPEDPLAGVPEISTAGTIEQKRRDGTVRVSCAACGAEVKPGEVPHTTVARVVRPGNRYAGSTAGQIVWVEPADLGGAITEATLSLDEHRAALEERRQAARPPQKPLLRDMVERSLKATIDQTRRLIEDGRVRAELDQKRAAAEAAALRRQGSAADAEPPSQPTAPVRFGA